MTTVLPIDSRVFTVEEANSALPLIRSITRDIVELSKSMMARRDLLNQIQRQRSDDERDVYNEELQDIEDILKSDAEKLKEYVEELSVLGVQLRSLADGVVGFPSLRDKRSIYLSWQYDEPVVAHWHELDEGFELRRPLEAHSKNRLAATPPVGTKSSKS